MQTISLKEENFEAGYTKAAQLGLYLPSIKIIPQQDISFSVYNGNNMIVHVPCFIIDKTAGWHDGTSSVPMFSPHENAETIAAASRLVVEQLHKILHMPDVSEIKVLSSEKLPESAFDCLSVTDNSRYYGYIDLTLSDTEIWRHLRKSYHSLINMGRRNYERRIYSNPLQIPRLVKEFIKNSRGMIDETYYGMLYRLSQASSAVFTYLIGDEIAAAIEVCSWNKFSNSGDFLYCIGAYNYEVNIPTHFCLYDSAMYFKDRSSSSNYYVMNASRCNRDLNDENQAKLAQIDFFKRGFCTHVYTRMYKTLRLGDDKSTISDSALNAQEMDRSS
jgi:hypothetical protein